VDRKIKDSVNFFINIILISYCHSRAILRFEKFINFNSMNYISNSISAFSVTILPTHIQADMCKYLPCIWSNVKINVILKL